MWREKCSHHGITQMSSPTYPLHKHNGCSGIKLKKKRARAREKKKREWEHFLNKGEKERKEGGDK